MKKLLLYLFVAGSISGYSQDDDWDFDEEGTDESSSVGPAFFDTRVINSQSVETLEQGTFDVRIAHRFGDMATPNSYKSMFGFDNSADIQIGVDYGITDRFMIGLHRNKGAGPFTQLFQGLVKYKILDQQDGKPFTLSVNSTAFATIMDKSSDSTSITYFRKTAHRFSYFTQLILARNLNDVASIQMNIGLLHRNLVHHEDVNTALSVGGVAKLKIAKKISLIGEYNHLFRPTNSINGITYTDPIGVGVEFKTHAHVFQVNFTNSRGMGEAQFIPYTFSKWGEGEFRMGFTISRHF
ncbi:DUF5777 family beta-barrel protein [Parvicella tangerina]|uniref:DUF5777 domain-containing protein n=1 Tax=Parvicella tangerina TaxID=2829795 RepID=A0A916JLZ6_9FLAO|nr:DUF5777 family beta-barrel protein [Parvicella tangerina]CAG5080870.1 hypothetical protein CRYO30217_01466 [Parvicella tangerina]